jgi:hypothetical protein
MVMLWLASYDEQRARIYCKEALGPQSRCRDCPSSQAGVSLTLMGRGCSAATSVSLRVAM